jgi:hypothetical protein
VTFDERAATIRFAFGRAELRAEEGTLVIEAIAATPAELERVEHVVGSHLVRFGRRDELAVAWTGPEAGARPSLDVPPDAESPGWSHRSRCSR